MNRFPGSLDGSLQWVRQPSVVAADRNTPHPGCGGQAQQANATEHGEQSVRCVAEIAKLGGHKQRRIPMRQSVWTNKYSKYSIPFAIGEDDERPGALHSCRLLKSLPILLVIDKSEKGHQMQHRNTQTNTINSTIYRTYTTY